MLSLDETTAEGRSAHQGPDQDALLRERQARHTRALRQALEELPGRERWIVEQRQLADPPWSYRALGGRLGVSGERVKQLEVRAIARLRIKLARLGIRSVADL
jgi:RNA polymerase sigma-32 factor